MAWYAIRVQSNREDHVKRTLERKVETHGLSSQIRKVVVPTEKVVEMKNGKKRTRMMKTYPGYVLVEMDMGDAAWMFIRETSGVGDFVGVGGGLHAKPFPLTDEEIGKLFGEVAGTEQKPQLKIDFKVGEKVKIKDGPFEDFDGAIDEIMADKGRIRVIVQIFGRASLVELEYWQAEKI